MEKDGGGLRGTLRGYSCEQDRRTMVWLLRRVRKKTASWGKHRKECPFPLSNSWVPPVHM